MRRAATTIPRARVEAAVEALLALLDTMDGDADLEPSLGSREGTLNGGGSDQRQWAAGESLDLEDEHDGRELSLGWSEREAGAGLLGGASDDREPSLAALDQPDQRRWAEHDDSGRRLSWLVDAEAQCEDEGADDERESDDDQTDAAWPEGAVA